MKKRSVPSRHLYVYLFLILLLSAGATVGAGAQADGAGDPWADYVVSTAQGTRKDGSPVRAVRSDSTAALGAPDGYDANGDFVEPNFYSLGYGGQIVLRFDNYICPGRQFDIAAYEVTGGPYPIELARVEVSVDGVHWTAAGTVNNKGQSTVNIPSSLNNVQYVRITDASSLGPHSSDADGYDLDSVEALHSQATPCQNSR